MTVYDKWSFLDENKLNADLVTSSGADELTVWEKLDSAKKVKKLETAESAEFSQFAYLSDERLAQEVQDNEASA